MDTTQFVDGGMHAERESFLQSLCAIPTIILQEKEIVLKHFSATSSTTASALLSSACNPRCCMFANLHYCHTLHMYDHVDAGAAQPLSLEQELLSFTGPNRAISVTIYSEFHAEVDNCLRLSGSSDIIAQVRHATIKPQEESPNFVFDVCSAPSRASGTTAA